MRKPSTLDALFTPPRRGILTATLMDPERWWYQSDLARHLSVHHATIQRELVRLSQAEILTTRRDGNRVYYRANRESPVFPELRALVTKTAGHAEILLAALKPALPEIQVAFIHGSIAKGSERAASDVDLMIIGCVTLKAIALAIRIDTPGPIFYRQERVGRNGRPFRCYKFRSMVANADALR